MNRHIKSIVFVFICMCVFNVSLHTVDAGVIVGSTSDGISSGVSTLNQGLVGYWTFNNQDMVNGAVKDKSGNNNTGNLVNIATSTFYTQGKLGQGFRFDGVDDYTKVNAASSVNNLSAMTVSVWSKARGYGGASAGRLVDKTQWIFSITSASGGSAGVDITFDGGTNLRRYSNGGTYNLGSWNHWVFTWDGTSNASGIRIYKNGVEVVYSGALDRNGVGNKTSDAASNLIIGNQAAAARAFDGVLDDVKIYNRALSSTEVRQLYLQGQTAIAAAPSPRPNVSSIDSGLVGYWTFNNQDMVNGAVKDKSGNNNTGNLVNIATSTFYTQGKLGQGFRFDGVNDYVTTPQLSTGTGPFSISAWVKVDDLTGKSFNNGVGIIAHFNNDLAGDFALSITSAYSVSFLNNRTGGNDPTGESETAINAVSKNKWAHVVATWDGSVNKIYVDGSNRSFSSSSWGDWGTESGFGRLANLSLYYYKGALDDVRVYNRALSSNEVKQIYNSGR